MVRSVSRWRAEVLLGLALVCAACGGRSPRDATMRVSYFAQGTRFESAAPLRVSVGSGSNLRSLRGMELTNRYPFLMSQETPLDSGIVLPVSVAMVNVPHDTLAQARLTLGPVQPATRYTVGVTVSRRSPAALGECGVHVAVPLRRDGGMVDNASRDGGRRADDSQDSLYVSIVGIREGGGC
jgi:hypothetical protein